MTSVQPRTTRATALPADERRAAIIAAALPLALERGMNVTTRQIADAAAIAEGTIFRVFPDKDALLAAVVDSALDPAPTEAALAEVDLTLPLEDRLERAVKILQQTIIEVWPVIAAVADSGTVRPRRPTMPRDLAPLVALFEPERRRLRLDPVAGARALQALTFAVSHPALYPDGPMAAREVVQLLLDGITKRAR